MKRLIAISMTALLALSGCSSDTALDAHTGTILAKRHTEEDTDCGGYNPISGKYDPFYCTTSPAEYFFLIDRDDRRFKNEETGRTRTEIGVTEVKIHNIASPDFAALTTSQRDANAKEQSELDRIASEERVRQAQQTLDEAKAADQAKLLNTPGYAESLERNAILEQIKACAAAPAGTCTIILGASGNSTTQLQVPVK